VSRVVIKEVRVQLGYISDPFAVGRPRWRGVGARFWAHLREVSSLVRIVRSDDPNVRFIISVGIRRTVAAESQRLAVRRPRRLVVIKVPGSNLRRRLCCNVENIKMRTAAIQVANRVAFELKPVNYKRWRSLGLRRRGRSRLFLILGGFQILRLGIAQNQNKPRTVGRPLEIVHALRNVGQSNCFSATAIEQPHLRLSSVTSGEKRNVFAVRAPARVP